MEADPRHCERRLADLELSGDGVKHAPTPGVKPTAQKVADENPLGETEHTKYRAIAARANYFAADGPDLHSACKEVCCQMAKPTDLAPGALKRVGRFVVGKPRLVWNYPFQDAVCLEVYSATD